MKWTREALRLRIGALEGSRERPRTSVDAGALDRWLGGGLVRGRVHAVAGPAATAFAAVVCARLRGPVLWCATREGAFPPLYPPGLAALGLEPDRLVMVRAGDGTAALGAAETGLREPGAAAVVVEVAAGLTSVRGRRLQLAAEAGGGLGLVLFAGTGEMGWAESGWEAMPAPACRGALRWRWTLRRVRRTRPASWLVEWSDATGALRVVSPVGDGLSGSAGAGGRRDGGGGDGRERRHEGGGGVGGGRDRGGEARHGVGRRPRAVSDPAGAGAGSRA